VTIINIIFLTPLWLADLPTFKHPTVCLVISQI